MLNILQKIQGLGEGVRLGGGFGCTACRTFTLAEGQLVARRSGAAENHKTQADFAGVQCGLKENADLIGHQRTKGGTRPDRLPSELCGKGVSSRNRPDSQFRFVAGA